MKLGKWFCHHNVRLVKPDRSINYLTFKGQLNFSKILTPGQGQLIPNWVMLHVKWLLSVRRIEWCHFYSKTFCQPLWPWLDPKVFLRLGHFDWPGDLTWGDLGLEFSRKVGKGCPVRYTKNGGAVYFVRTIKLHWTELNLSIYLKWNYQGFEIARNLLVLLLIRFARTCQF